MRPFDQSVGHFTAVSSRNCGNQNKRTRLSPQMKFVTLLTVKRTQTEFSQSIRRTHYMERKPLLKAIIWASAPLYSGPELHDYRPRECGPGSLTLPRASSYILYENELQKSDCPASRNFIHSSMGKRSERKHGGCKSFCPEFEKAKLVQKRPWFKQHGYPTLYVGKTPTFSNGRN